MDFMTAVPLDIPCRDAVILTGIGAAKLMRRMHAVCFFAVLE